MSPMKPKYETIMTWDVDGYLVDVLMPEDRRYVLYTPAKKTRAEWKFNLAIVAHDEDGDDYAVVLNTYYMMAKGLESTVIQRVSRDEAYMIAVKCVKYCVDNFQFLWQEKK